VAARSGLRIVQRIGDGIDAAARNAGIGEINHPLPRGALHETRLQQIIA
jgi:hypothetical protein